MVVVGDELLEFHLDVLSQRGQLSHRVIGHLRHGCRDIVDKLTRQRRAFFRHIGGDIMGHHRGGGLGLEQPRVQRHGHESHIGQDQQDGRGSSTVGCAATMRGPAPVRSRRNSLPPDQRDSIVNHSWCVPFLSRSQPATVAFPPSSRRAVGRIPSAPFGGFRLEAYSRTTWRVRRPVRGPASVRYRGCG